MMTWSAPSFCASCDNPNPAAPQAELIATELRGHLTGTGSRFQLRRERRSFFTARAYLRRASTINSWTWRKPAPWLRGAEKTLIGIGGKAIRVLDGLFFESL